MVVYQLSPGFLYKSHSLMSHFCAHASSIDVILGLSVAKHHSFPTSGQNSILMIATTVVNEVASCVKQEAFLAD